MPLTYYKQVGTDARMALWKIEESCDQLSSMLGKDCQDVSRPNSDKDRVNLQWLASRNLIRQMLSENEPMVVQKDVFGKPHLSGSPYKISISHSFDYAAVLINSDCEAGIDIEKISDRAVRVSSKFISTEEFKMLRQPNDQEMVTLIWAMKEAVYKFYGRKELDFRKHIRVNPFNLQRVGHCAVDLLKGQEAQQLMVRYEKFGDYMIAYVLENMTQAA